MMTWYIIKKSKQTIHYIFFFIFLLLYSHYVADLIKKLELYLMVVSVKVNIGHAQITVPKISTLMSKTACINTW